MNTEWNEINKDDLEYMINEGCNLGGYDEESFLVVTGWDIVDSPKLNQYFKDSDNWGFDDEYTNCAECYQVIIRTSVPDYYLDDECGYICSECAQDYKEDCILEIQNKIDNKDQPKSYPHIFDLDDTWIKVESDSYNSTWCNGLHHGMNDDPLRQGQIVRSLKFHQNSILQVIFKVYPSQFNVDWDTFIRLDPDSEIKLSNTDLENIAAEFSNRFNSEEGHFPYDIASLYESALKNLDVNFASINVDPNTGDIDIQGSNNIDDYMENIK